VKSPRIPGQVRRLLSVKVSGETFRALAATGHPSTTAARVLEEWAESVGALLLELAAAEAAAPDQL
jgi:hypothetical protein